MREFYVQDKDGKFLFKTLISDSEISRLSILLQQPNLRVLSVEDEDGDVFVIVLDNVSVIGIGRPQDSSERV